MGRVDFLSLFLALAVGSVAGTAQDHVGERWLGLPGQRGPTAAGVVGPGSFTGFSPASRQTLSFMPESPSSPVRGDSRRTVAGGPGMARRARQLLALARGDGFIDPVAELPLRYCEQTYTILSRRQSCCANRSHPEPPMKTETHPTSSATLTLQPLLPTGRLPTNASATEGRQLTNPSASQRVQRWDRSWNVGETGPLCAGSPAWPFQRLVGAPGAPARAARSCFGVSDAPSEAVGGPLEDSGACRV
jgi:hypothetical protein